MMLEVFHIIFFLDLKPMQRIVFAEALFSLTIFSVGLIIAIPLSDR